MILGIRMIQTDRKPQPDRPRFGRHWKGGRIEESGYIRVYRPSHIRANNGYVLEHILIVEAVLGKELSRKHPIHHVDENGLNNRNGNLVVCESQSYHKILHLRTRALREFGDANARQCVHCRKWGMPDDDLRVVNRRDGALGHAYHRSCSADHEYRRRNG